MKQARKRTLLATCLILGPCFKGKYRLHLQGRNVCEATNQHEASIKKNSSCCLFHVGFLVRKNKLLSSSGSKRKSTGSRQETELLLLQSSCGFLNFIFTRYNSFVSERNFKNAFSVKAKFLFQPCVIGWLSPSYTTLYLRRQNFSLTNARLRSIYALTNPHPIWK
jgi:hypothetical protein